MSWRTRRNVSGAARHLAWPADSSGPTASAGFTVIELTLVIVIVAILGAIAGPRFFGNSAFDERAYYDEVVASLRYAQKVAVATGCRVRVDIAATTYAVMQQSSLSGHCDPADVSFPVPVLLASGEAVTGTAPDGVTAVPAITLIYEPLGSTTLAADQLMAVGTRSFSIPAARGGGG